MVGLGLSGGCQLLLGFDPLTLDEGAAGSGGTVSSSQASSGPAMGGAGGSGGMGTSSASSGGSGGSGGAEPCAGAKGLCALWVERVGEPLDGPGGGGSGGGTAPESESRQALEAVAVANGRVWAAGVVAGRFEWKGETETLIASPPGESDHGDAFLLSRSIEPVGDPKPLHRLIPGDRFFQGYRGAVAVGDQVTLLGAYQGSFEAPIGDVPSETLPPTTAEYDGRFYELFVEQGRAGAGGFETKALFSSTSPQTPSSVALWGHHPIQLKAGEGTVLVAGYAHTSFAYTDAKAAGAGKIINLPCPSISADAQLEEKLKGCETGLLLALSEVGGAFSSMLLVGGKHPDDPLLDGQQRVLGAARSGGGLALGGFFTKGLDLGSGLDVSEGDKGEGFVAKTSTLGTGDVPPELAWVARIGSESGTGFDFVSDVAMKEDRIVVVGTYGGPLTMDPPVGVTAESWTLDAPPAPLGLYVGTYDGAGKPIALEPLAAYTNLGAGLGRVVLGEPGVAYVFGFAVGSLRSGEGYVDTKLVDGFVAKVVLETGKVGWLEPIDGGGNEFLGAAAFDATAPASLYVAGTFDADFNLAGSPLQIGEGGDAFLARLVLPP